MNEYECENCSLFIHDDRKFLTCPIIPCTRKFLLCDACFQKLLFCSLKPYMLRYDSKLCEIHLEDEHKAVSLV